MAHNPVKRRKRPASLSRTKKYRKTKSSLKVRGFRKAKGKGGKSRMIHFGKKRRTKRKVSRRRNFMEATIKPATRIVPSMKDLTAEAQTAFVGAGAFVLSNALGLGVNKVIGMMPASVTGPMQSVMGIVKFAGRYLGARALSSKVFTKTSGILSKQNGAIVKEIVVITGGLALINDFGLLRMLPASIQAMVPSLSGMSNLERMGLQKYVQGGTLSKYVHGGTLGKYVQGTPRQGISAYTDFNRGSWNLQQPQGAVNLGNLPGGLDKLPLETPEVSSHGIPFGH
jgi:hypothetical protein